MGLKNIHRRTERGPSPIAKLSSAFSKITAKKPPAPAQPRMMFQKMPHERSMITPKKAGGPQMRKDAIMIAAIAAATIIVIAFMFMSKGGGPTASGNETSNATENQTNQTEPVPVVILKPDLSITDFTVSSDEVTTGEPVTISVEYENRGKAAVNRTVIQVFAGSKLLREDVLENFTDGDSGELSLNWTPDETEVGQRVLKVSIDPHNEISEETESNNEQTQTVTVIQSIIKDVSSSFKLRTTTGFGDRWYSDRYNLVPKSGPDMTYFQIYPESGGTYLLDVGIAGFRATKSGLDIYRIEVPDSSEDGWNSGVCVRDYAEGSDCIWMGPSMTFTIGFSRGDIVATDQSSVKSRTASSKSKVDEIELAAMTVADWPGTLKTFKVTGAGTPNKFVPSDFYSVQGSMIYVNPLIWNPETGEAKVATTYSFRITPK